jgi:hypothetical protein
VPERADVATHGRSKVEQTSGFFSEKAHMQAGVLRALSFAPLRPALLAPAPSLLSVPLAPVDSSSLSRLTTLATRFWVSARMDSPAGATLKPNTRENQSALLHGSRFG